MKLKILALTLLWSVLLSGSVAAAPLFNVPTTLTQPDGTPLQAYASGDEFFNYLHDRTGHILKQHPETGFWVYAALDAAGLLVASDRVATGDGRAPRLGPGITTADIDFRANAHLVGRMDILEEDAFVGFEAFDATGATGATGATDATGATGTTDAVGLVRTHPIQGEIQNIVIVIAFADDDAAAVSDTLYAAIADRFNGPERSLRHFMYLASEGALVLDSTLVGLYRSSQPRGYFQRFNAAINPIGYNPAYFPDRPDTGNPQSVASEGQIRGQAMLSSAVAYMDGHPLLEGLALNTLRADRVDSTTFVVKGQLGVWGQFLWPHRWSLQFHPSYLGGVRVWDYSLVLTGDTPTYPQLIRSVIVHEQLHIFSVPDFYRYTDAGRPVGQWDMMSNPTEARFPFTNAHIMRRYVGWGSAPEVIAQSGTFTLHPRGTPGETTAFVIPVEDRPNEFILLEYISAENPTPFDHFGLEANFHAGLVISRINTSFRGNENRLFGQTAFAFEDEVYIFRPGTSVRNAASLPEGQASLSANVGRTTFGHPYATGYDSIIYTYEGYNTGIVVYDVGYLGPTLTFRVALHDVDITPLSPEAWLRAAITGDRIVYLAEDVILSERQEPLRISAGSNITLRSADGATFAVIAGGDFDAIAVDAGGSLTLDGVNVGRVADTFGRGVTNAGHLTLLDGVVSGHHFVGAGGGVGNTTGATFIQYGGAISGNTATIHGGGIFNWGTVAIHAGEISGNTALSNGGGIGANPAPAGGEWEMNVTVGPDAVFAGNTAANPRNRPDRYDALYYAQIFGTRWTYPFIQGFNNFDLFVPVNGPPATFRTLSFEESLAIVPIQVVANTPIVRAPSFPAHPTRPGYVFAGWYRDAAFAQPLAETLMPNSDFTIFARWEEAPVFFAGDVNGDGVVDLNDVTLLARYLAGHDVHLVNRDAAKVTAATRLQNFPDLRDVMRLRRYLADHNVELVSAP